LSRFSELSRRISCSDNGPPEKRLRLAVRAFESPHLRVARKEEAVLEALCKLESWEALRKCLQSERFARAALRPTVRKKLVQTCSKDAECGRLLLLDTQTAFYLAARPQEFNQLCSALFECPDPDTVRAAVSCARRSPTPMTLAPFVAALAVVDLDDEVVGLIASVVSNGQEVLDSLDDSVCPKSAKLAARIVAAKFGRGDSRTEEFVQALTEDLSDNEAIGHALASLEAIENRDWLISLFNKILAGKKQNILSAFRPLSHLDLQLFETLLPQLVTIVGGNGDIDSLLVDSLVDAEREQRAHKLVPKILEGITSSSAPVMDKFPAALAASALKWPSKHLSAAIAGLIYFFENRNGSKNLFFAMFLRIKINVYFRQ